ncbi:MAG: hypothetical protein ACKVHE_35480 [Planctomycetales bacterium]
MVDQDYMLVTISTSITAAMLIGFFHIRFPAWHLPAKVQTRQQTLRPSTRASFYLQH